MRTFWAGLIILFAIGYGESFIFGWGESCTAPKGSWRLKQSLNSLDWVTAKMNFGQAFSNPNNENFAQKTILGIDEGSYTVINDTAWTVTYQGGLAVEVFTIDDFDPTCVKERSDILRADGLRFNISPFAGIEREWDTGEISFVMGFESCSVNFFDEVMINSFCNEAIIANSMLTNVKRYGCMVEFQDAELCGGLFAGGGASSMSIADSLDQFIEENNISI